MFLVLLRSRSQEVSLCSLVSGLLICQTTAHHDVTGVVRTCTHDLLAMMGDFSAVAAFFQQPVQSTVSKKPNNTETQSAGAHIILTGISGDKQHITSKAFGNTPSTHTHTQRGGKRGSGLPTRNRFHLIIPNF